MDGNFGELKWDDEGFLFWLSRMGVDDGEPFESTVYVEMDIDGKRETVGHYDGDADALELIQDDYQAALVEIENAGPEKLTVVYASMTLSDGRIFQITDAVQSIVDAVESHYERLREFVNESDGDYDDGYMEWEGKYARAEGEESIANVGMELAELVGVVHPSEEEWADDEEAEVAK